PPEPSENHDHHQQHYEPLAGEEGEETTEAVDGSAVLSNASGQVSLTTDGTATKQGFLEFLREPFMLVGDI
ncbi:MAG: hypothetical protein SGILL_005473, partial [Bacillariaceae sp.]